MPYKKEKQAKKNSVSDYSETLMSLAIATTKHENREPGRFPEETKMIVDNCGNMLLSLNNGMNVSIILKVNFLGYLLPCE